MAAPPKALTVLYELIGSARFSQALTVSAVALAFLAPVVRVLIGWPGLIAILVGIVALATASLSARREGVEWRGLLPISLIAFVGWCGLSIFWSQYQWATLGGSLYQLTIAYIGVYIALTRDLIQIVRAFGDVLRGILIASLVLEVFSGILIDMPITFLRIQGDIALGGPIQGLLGTRNALGLVALIALITFAIELVTRSLAMPRAIASVALAATTIAFTRSTIVMILVVLVALATLVILLLRRVPQPRRRVWQAALGAFVVVVVIAAFLVRTRVLAVLNAESEFEFRYDLWRQIFALSSLHPLEGFGWTGLWHRELPPFSALQGGAAPHASAANAFVDVFFQVGAVGAVLFVVLLSLAVARSWLLATSKRSIIFLWPALVAGSLALVSVVESTILVEFGWLTFVICAVRASHELSWRQALRATDRPGDD